MTLVGLSDPKGGDRTSATVTKRGVPKLYSIPIERIESLRSVLHFRVPLEGNSVNELEVVR